MRALTCRPFCYYDSRWVSLGYLSAGCRYTTLQSEEWTSGCVSKGQNTLLAGNCWEASLRHALTQYVEYFHHERHHQGKGNVLLFPASS
jgi:hypothetical protein